MPGGVTALLLLLGWLLTIVGIGPSICRSAEQYLALMSEAGVEKSLIVQPILYLYDHSCACIIHR